MNQGYVFFGAAGNLGWRGIRRLMSAVQKQVFHYH
jgi:hypothetical protein